MSNEIWFPVVNRLRSESPQTDIVTRQSQPLIVFHALSNTGSLSAIYALLKYFEQRQRHTIGSTPSSLLDPDEQQHAPMFDQYFTHLRACLAPETNRASFTAAHYLLGIHHFLRRPVVYVTFLRDPVMTYISRAYFMHTGGGAGGKPVHRPDLERLIDEREGDNLLCQDLGRPFTHQGKAMLPAPFATAELLPEEALNAAQQNIDQRFGFIGITELFEESLFLLCDRFGFDALPLWTREMATKGRPDRAAIPPRVLQKLERLLTADLTLYERERTRFLERLAAADFGSTLLEYKAASAGA